MKKKILPQGTLTRRASKEVRISYWEPQLVYVSASSLQAAGLDHAIMSESYAALCVYLRRAWR